MPRLNKKARQRRAIDEELLEIICEYLANGTQELAGPGGAVVRMFWRRGDYDDDPRLLEVWQRHGDEISSLYSAKHPGCRPWGWWKFEATEPRRTIVDWADTPYRPFTYGNEPADDGSRWFGIHRQHLRNGAIVTPLLEPAIENCYESQREYLERHGPT